MILKNKTYFSIKQTGYMYIPPSYKATLTIGQPSYQVTFSLHFERGITAWKNNKGKQTLTDI
jgi:hypothetical protein